MNFEAEGKSGGEAASFGTRRRRDHAAGAINVLSVIHGTNARAGIFGEVVRGAGHVLEEWSLAWDTPPPRPIDDYGAVLVFGGAMHADQDDLHPWLRDENLFIKRLLDHRVPTLGVCLGAQLIAKAAHAPVFRASEPEIGWIEVERSPEAADDPVFGALPERFHSFQWHYYSYEVPAGAEELARSRVCTQAFRLGDAAWGMQFHAEVDLETVRAWLEQGAADAPIDTAALAQETEQRIGEWNRIGAAICGSFVKVAERAAVPA
jgi:GMP synthase (glutamine-hydrolysing)